MNWTRFLRREAADAEQQEELGLVSSATLSRWISPLLYEVAPFDPLTYAISGAALAGGAIFASVVPARRAASVDLMETLRSD